MDTQKNIKNEVLFRAEKVLHYNNLLIEQCNNWLSAEEGNEKMMKQIMEKERAKKKIKIKNFLEITNINKIVRNLRIKN